MRRSSCRNAVGSCCRVLMVSIREPLFVVGMSDVTVCDNNSDGAVKQRNDGAVLVGASCCFVVYIVSYQNFEGDCCGNVGQ